MGEESSRTDLVAGGLLGLLTAAGSLEPVRNYDYFWHLASGRWIVSHRALPASDPFTLASHDHTWVNLEWLFQIALDLLFRLLGHAGLTLLLTIAVGLGTAALFLYLRARTTRAAALFLVALAWMGAAHRIDLRPETAAIPLLVLFLALLLRVPERSTVVILPLITILWFGIHPSALLAPVLAGLVFLGCLIDREAESRERWRRFWVSIGCGIALLFNPWFLEGVLAPVRLASLLRREGLVNLEWLPSLPTQFPELYVIIIVAVIVVAVRRSGERRWARLFVLLFLAVLAARYVRNHAFFYPALSILIAPSIPDRRESWDRMFLIAAALCLVNGFLMQHPGLGIDRARFPVSAVEIMQEAGLRGNVYTPDQLGGFLVWELYPERRTLVDGRNELYVEFFRRFEKARGDSREWRALFEDYDLTIAVDEYRGAAVKMVDGVTGESRMVPPSTVYYPPDEWALIAFDEAAMIFARRETHPPELIEALELSAIVPDATGPESVTRGSIEEALNDLEKLQKSVGLFPRMEQLAIWLGEARTTSVHEVGAVERLELFDRPPFADHSLELRADRQIELGGVRW